MDKIYEDGTPPDDAAEQQADETPIDDNSSQPPEFDDSNASDSQDPQSGQANDGQDNAQPNDDSDDGTPSRFEKLYIIDSTCFGYSKYEEFIKTHTEAEIKEFDPEKLEEMKSWTDMVDDINDIGWDKFAEENLERFENSLKEDIEKSYVNIATIKWKDAKTDTNWDTKFINDKMLWRLSIGYSPNANVLKDDNVEFFKSDKFTEYARQLDGIILNALAKYKKVVQQHVENGELLNIDEVKLAALLFWMADDEKSFFLSNFRTGQFTHKK